MADLAPNEVGVAYVTLLPSMKTFNREVRKSLKDMTETIEATAKIQGARAGIALSKAFQQNTGDLAKEFLDRFKSQTEPLEEESKQKGGKIATGFTAALKDALADTKLGNAIKVGLSGASNIINEVLGAHKWLNVGVQGAIALGKGLAKVTEQVVKIGADIAKRFVQAFADVGKQICSYIVSGVKQAYTQVGGIMVDIGKSQVSTAAKNLGVNLGGGITEGLTSAKVAIGNILGGLVSSAAGAIKGSVSSAISRVDTMKNFPKILANMGIGAEDAEASIAALSEAIDGLPTTLDDAALGTERLVAKNGDIAKSTKYFTALNNAIIAGGAGTELQKSAIEQLTQAYSKGSMDMMEWRSLSMAMPAQLNQIAESIGMTSDELGEGLRKGNISMDEFMDTLVKLNEEGGEGFASFAEQAKTSSKTISVALTNVQNRINKATATVIDWVGQENIFNVIESVSTKFGPLATQLTEFLDKIEAKSYIVQFAQAFGDAIGQISEKAEPLKTALAPLLEGALPAALEVTKNTLDKVVEKAGPFIERVSGFVSEIPNMASGIQPIIDAFVNAQFDTWTAALEMWQKVLPDISAQLPTIIEAQTKVTQSVATLAGNLSGTLAPVVGNLFKNVSDLIAKAEPFVERVITGLVPVFETIETQIIDVVTKTMEAVDKVTVFTRDGDMDLITYASQTLSEIMETVGGSVGRIIQTLVPYIPSILDMVDRIVAALAPAVEKIVTVLAPYIPKFADLFASAAEQLAPAIADSIEKLAPHLDPLMELVKKLIKFAAENAPGLAETIGNIVDFVAPILGDVLDLVDAWLPAIEGFINTFIDLLEGLYEHTLKPIFQLVQDIGDFISDPSWEKFSGQFTNNSSVPSVRPMAEGGIATRPTRALIAEAGTPEAVVPLSASGIAKFTGGLAPQYVAGGAPTVTVRIDTFMNYDTDRDVRTLSEEIGRDTLRQLKMQGVYA